MNSTLSRIRYNKSQRIAIFMLMLFLLCIEGGIWWIDKKEIQIPKTEIPAEIKALRNQIDAQEGTSNYKSSKDKSVQIQKFNPNILDKEGWMELGFSPKQAAVILKYKNSLGGNFSSKSEISKCFVISDEKFEEIAPYILLPENSGNNSSGFNSNYYSQNKSKPKIHYQKFNPNEYSQNDWMAIGFSEKQALTILKYKRSLGGKFSSLEQIERCFVISEEKFQEMKPYMVISKSEEIAKNETKTEMKVEVPVKVQLEKFKPNEISREQWMDLGFTEKQVNTIFNYKRSLGGKFKDAATLKRCYSISEEKFAEIEPYLVFD